MPLKNHNPQSKGGQTWPGSQCHQKKTCWGALFCGRRTACSQKVNSTGNLQYIICNVTTKTEEKSPLTTRDWCQLLKKVSFISSALDIMLRAWIQMELFQNYSGIEFTLGEQGCVHPSSSFSCQQHIRKKWFVQLRRPFTTWLSSEV